MAPIPLKEQQIHVKANSCTQERVATYAIRRRTKNVVNTPLGVAQEWSKASIMTIGISRFRCLL